MKLEEEGFARQNTREMTCYFGTESVGLPGLELSMVWTIKTGGLTGRQIWLEQSAVFR